MLSRVSKSCRLFPCLLPAVLPCRLSRPQEHRSENTASTRLLFTPAPPGSACLPAALFLRAAAVLNGVPHQILSPSARPTSSPSLQWDSKGLCHGLLPNPSNFCPFCVNCFRVVRLPGHQGDGAQNTLRNVPCPVTPIPAAFSPSSCLEFSPVCFLCQFSPRFTSISLLHSSSNLFRPL